MSGVSYKITDAILNDNTNNPGWKTTELWLTSITGLVSTILASTAPAPTTTTLIICLTITAVTYLLCRTIFKISKLKYRPTEIVNFKAQGNNTFKEPMDNI